MRIGISIHTHEGQSIWSGGALQNAVFMARSFQRLPFVRSVAFIDTGTEADLPPQVDMEALALRRIPMHEAGDEVDVIVELAGALDTQWLSLMRARGRKIVFACRNQPYASTIEPSVFDKPANFSSLERCDEVWLLPKDEAFAPMLRTLHRSPVHVVPFVWDAHFVRQRIAEIERLGFRFGYSPPAPAAGLRVAVFEPNVSTVKTSSIPMLACDEAHRAEPGSIAAMHVLNTLHLKDHPTMLHLANSLDLVRGHKAVFHGRHDVVGFMAQHVDAVVSHQWQNAQNYNHLDVLYGNYPLVHNSDWLQGFGAGYHYPGFEAEAAGRQLRFAAARHDAQQDDYRARSQRVFDAVDPFNKANLAAFAERLLQLCVDDREGSDA